MNYKLGRFLVLQCSTLLLSSLLGSTLVTAGEPPFPSELLYPNVVPPAHQFGTYGVELGAFSEPRGACFVERSQLAVVENGNRRVQIVSTDGRGIEIWTPEMLGDPGLFVSLSGIACRDSTVVLADAGANEIVVLNKSGQLLSRFGGFGAQVGKLNNPSGVAVRGDMIAVADTGNDRIQVFSKEGQLLLSFGAFGKRDGQFNHPVGVAFDEEGNIYVADAWNNRIQKFSTSGVHLVSWGEWGSHAGLFATPSSVVISGRHIYVTDLTNHRIQAFDLFGHFLFQWGRHPPSGHEGNGRTHYPWNLAVGEGDDVFALVEPIENRIQVFEKIVVSNVKNVNDSAWWDKATKFHYGSRSELAGSLMAISEPDTHSVLIFDVSSDSPKLISRLGGRGQELGKLIEPSGMSIDESRGEVLVVDAGNLRLQRLGLVKAATGDKSLQYFESTQGYLNDLGNAIDAEVTVFSDVPKTADDKVNVEKAEKFASILSSRPLAFNLNATETLIYPGALKRAPDGEIYLYDQSAARILIFRDGVIRGTFGGYGTEPGKFRGVHNMSFSKDGTTLFVVDPYNFRVQMFDRNGGYINSFGRPGHADDEFSSIFGITSGVDGFVYLTDETKHCIYKYTEGGVFVARWSRWGTEPGELYKPKGISQDANGKLYVLSFGNHRGEMFDPNGKHLGSFGLADPDTARGQEISGMLRARPTYDASAKILLNRDSTALLNKQLVTTKPDGDIEIVSNGGRYKVTVHSSAPLSVADQPKRLTVAILEMKTGKAADVDLSFDSIMPAHNHGLTSRPSIKKIKKGTFDIENINLSMMGLWELYFDVRDRFYAERAQAAVFVR